MNRGERRAALVAQAIELVRMGMSDQDVAARLGVSPRTIQGWRYENGIRYPRANPRSRHPETIRRAAFADLRNGMAPRAVAEKYKLPYGTVKNWRSQPYRPPAPAPVIYHNGYGRGIHFEGESLLRMLDQGGYSIRDGGAGGLPLHESQARHLRRVVTGETRYISERYVDEILCALDLTLSMFDERPVWLTGQNENGEIEALPMPEDWMDYDWSQGYERVMASIEVAA